MTRWRIDTPKLCQMRSAIFSIVTIKDAIEICFIPTPLVQVKSSFTTK
jgi:hypothetical protein